MKKKQNCVQSLDHDLWGFGFIQSMSQTCGQIQQFYDTVLLKQQYLICVYAEPKLEWEDFLFPEVKMIKSQ
jgi:hypothetical protein